MSNSNNIISNGQNNNPVAQWEFSFDLNMVKLATYYNKNRTQSYKEIENFLFNNGFNNRSDKQGSCYFTGNAMTFTRANRILRRMFRTLPWVPVCLSKAALTKRENDYDLMLYANALAKSKSHQKALDDYRNGICNANAIKPKKKSKSR